MRAVSSPPGLKGLLIVLLISATIPIAQMQCIHKGDEIDCSDKKLTSLPFGFDRSHVKYLVFNKNQLTGNENPRWNGLNNLISLKLNFNIIEKPEASFLANLPILKYLYLIGNKIFVISDSMFDKITTLTHLNLDYNKIEQITINMFTKLHLLKYLSVGNNHISGIHEDSLNGLVNINTIYLNMNNLRELPPTLFKNNKQLFIIDLSNNKLTSLNDHLFTGLSKLRHLRLSSNLLTEVKNNLFLSIPLLFELNLSHNRINNFHQSTFKNMVNLKHLDLASNNITIIQDKLFDMNLNMKHLYLHNNLITNLTNNIFNKLHNLQVLDLARNQLKMVSQSWFTNSLKLTSLDLSYNEINNLQNNLFHNLNFLKHLDISFNHISTLLQDIFSKNKMLKSVKINNNKIEHLPVNMFVNNINLEKIYMYQNKLKTVPSQLFQKQEALKVLKLSHNNISDLSFDIFSKLKNLEIVDLHNNQLNKLPENLFTNNAKLQRIIISFNFFEFMPSKLFESLLRLKYLDISFNNLKTFPYLFTNYLLNTAFLNGNSFEAISSNMFQHIRELQQLNMEGGKLKNYRCETFLSFNRNVIFHTIKLPLGSTVWCKNKAEHADLKARKFEWKLKLCNTNSTNIECSDKKVPCSTIINDIGFVANCSNIKNVFTQKIYNEIIKDIALFNATTPNFVINRLWIPNNIQTGKTCRQSDVKYVGTGSTREVTGKCIQLDDIISNLKHLNLNKLTITTDYIFMKEPAIAEFTVLITANSFGNYFPFEMIVKVGNNTNFNPSISMNRNSKVEVHHLNVNLIGDNNMLQSILPKENHCLPKESQIFDFESKLMVNFLKRTKNPKIENIYYDLKSNLIFSQNNPEMKSITIFADTIVIDETSINASKPTTIWARNVKINNRNIQWDEEPRLYKIVDHTSQRHICNYFYKKGKLNIHVLGVMQNCPDNVPYSPHSNATIADNFDYVASLMMHCSYTLKYNNLQESKDMQNMVYDLSRMSKTSEAEYLRSESENALHNPREPINFIPYLKADIYTAMLVQFAKIVENQKSKRRRINDIFQSISDRFDSHENTKEDIKFSIQKNLEIKTILKNGNVYTIASKNNILKYSKKRYADAIEESKNLYRSYEEHNKGIGSALKEVKKGIKNKEAEEKKAEKWSIFGSIFTAIAAVVLVVATVASGGTLAAVAAPFLIVGATYTLGADVGKAVVEANEAISTLDGVLKVLSDLTANMPSIVDIEAANYASWESSVESVTKLIGSLESQTSSGTHWEVFQLKTQALCRDDYVKSIDGMKNFEKVIFHAANFAEKTADQTKLAGESFLEVMKVMIDVYAAERTQIDLEKQIENNKKWKNGQNILDKEYIEKISEPINVIIENQKNLFYQWRSIYSLVATTTREYCRAYFFNYLKKCSVTISGLDSSEALLNKITTTQVEEIQTYVDDRLQTLKFTGQGRILVEDPIICNNKTQIHSRAHCPVQEFKDFRSTMVRFKDYDSIRLQGYDRVRVTTLRVILEGVDVPLGTKITLKVTTPSTFKDRIKGATYTFVASPKLCLVVYSQNQDKSVQFNSDCSVSPDLKYAFSSTSADGYYEISEDPKKPLPDLSSMTGFAVELEGYYTPSHL